MYIYKNEKLYSILQEVQKRKKEKQNYILISKNIYQGVH